MQPTLELRLLLACSRVRLEPGDRQALGECLAGPVDWSRVIALARWHGLRPLLNRHLALEGEGSVPRAVLLECWAEAEAVARGNRVLRAELGRVLSLLDEAGIRALPYKGPTLALIAYGDPGLREYGDLDLLLASAEARRAADVLCASGYEREYLLEPHIEAAYVASNTQYHLTLRGPGGVRVELHWKTDPDFPVERLDDAQWWARVRSVDGIATLPDEDLLLVLLLHGAKHAWSSLGWLVDVAELLRAGGHDWARLAARVESMAVGRRVGTGLRLAADLLGAPLAPPALTLATRADVASAAARIASVLLAAQPRDPGAWESVRLLADQHDRRATFIRALYRSVCNPSLVEWTRWPLPRPLFFAYPPLRMGRLAAKYLARTLQRASGGSRLHL